MPLIARRLDTDEIVAPGTQVVSFRGDSWLLIQATAPTGPGGVPSGKVLVTEDTPQPLTQRARREFNANVFNLYVADEE